MKKRVLFVIYSIFGGGAERQMQYILKYLDRKRFSPLFCVFKLSIRERELVPSDIPIYVLDTKFRPASLVLIFKLCSLIKKLKPDYILSFMWGANVISIIAGTICKTKIMVSERTFTEEDIKHYSLSYLRKLLISFLYKKATKVVAVCERVRANLIEYFKIPSEKIEVIFNGIDIETIVKKMDDYSPALEGYILACGSLEPVKNYLFLLEVMERIKKMYTIPLVILGEGSQREILERKAEEKGINLILPGFVKNPYPWFKKAKVFVLTSKYEGFPNVILEAWACGVPVVAVDCAGGVRDLIKNGENGLLVRENDKVALVQAIQRLLSNSDLKEKLVRNAKKSLLQYDVHDMVKKYEDLFKINWKCYEE